MENTLVQIIWAISIPFSGIFYAWYAKRNDDAFGEWFIIGLIYPFIISIPAVLYCSRKSNV